MRSQQVREAILTIVFLSAVVLLTAAVDGM